MIADNEVTEDENLYHFSLLEDVESINHNGALKDEAWKAAMIEELAVIERYNTRQLVLFLINSKQIEVKWVYKMKHNHAGSFASKSRSCCKVINNQVSSSSSLQNKLVNISTYVKSEVACP